MENSLLRKIRDIFVQTTFYFTIFGLYIDIRLIIMIDWTYLLPALTFGITSTVNPITSNLKNVSIKTL